MARRPNRWSAWEDDVLRREVAAQSMFLLAQNDGYLNIISLSSNAHHANRWQNQLVYRSWEIATEIQ